MKLLVVIANYGTKNDAYLARVLGEYRQMPCETGIVVLSNLPKDLGPDVEVVVGLPTRNPMSLPFGHKKIFAERQDAYDIFLYAEDDMLVTWRNIETTLRISKVLPRNELVGFFQWEQYPDGRRFFPAVHGHFHWVLGSVKTVGEYTLAQFTNEHSACYLLTRAQLKDALASGGYLVPPHEGKYTLLETASTDPFTQCGFRKLLCLSHFEDLLVAHLPNKYAGGGLGLDEEHFFRQMAALQRLGNNGSAPKPLLNAENRLLHRRWSKSYYEAPRENMLALLPAHTRTVLSIGCGWGAHEAELQKKGIQVIGIPLDGVIAECARSRGLEMVCGDLEAAAAQLRGREFDAVMMPGILHLLPDPAKAVRIAASFLKEDGVLVASLPNTHRVPFLWRRLRYPAKHRGVGDYKKSGMHAAGPRQIARWFSQNGLRIRRVAENVPENWRRAVALSSGLAAPLLSLEYVVTARKARGGRHAAPALEQRADHA